MARPLRMEYEGAVYHVTARGNERKKIYSCKRDYEKFIEYLANARNKYKIMIHCYVLMSNHYHLIIETPEANLSRAMHYINGSYTTYFNKKTKRSGHLFQGRYKSFMVDKNNYLLELSRYVHLNPVRAGIVERPESYQYSSYKMYTSNTQNELITDHLVLGLVEYKNGNAKENYRKFVESAVGIDLDNPAKDVYGGMILGSTRFIKETLRTIKEENSKRDEVSRRKELRAAFSIRDVLEAVSDHYMNMQKKEGIKLSEPRDVAIYLMKERTGATNNEIGEMVGGLSYSSVSKIYQKTKVKVKGNRKMKRKASQIEKSLYNFKG